VSHTGLALLLNFYVVSVTALVAFAFAALVILD
jgi:hypothetical protein